MNPLLEIKVPTNSTKGTGGNEGRQPLGTARSSGNASPSSPSSSVKLASGTSAQDGGDFEKLHLPRISVQDASDSPTVTTSSGAGEAAGHTYHFNGRDVELAGKIALIAVLLRTKAAAEERVQLSNIVSLSDLKNETQPRVEESGITRDKVEAKQPSSPKGITRFMPEKLRRAAAIAFGGFTLGGAVPKGDGAIFDPSHMREEAIEMLNNDPELQPLHNTGFIYRLSKDAGISCVLVAPNVVITARHANMAERDLSDFRVGFGRNFKTDPGRLYKIKQVFDLPESFSLLQDTDVTVCLLEEPVEGAGPTVPIAVISEHEVQYKDEVAVVGFGRYLPEMPQDGERDLYADKVRGTLSGVSSNYFTTNALDLHLPTSGIPVAYSYGGASGGGASWWNAEQSRWELVGIASEVVGEFTHFSRISQEAKSLVDQVIAANPVADYPEPEVPFEAAINRGPVGELQISFPASDNYIYILERSIDGRIWEEIEGKEFSEDKGVFDIKVEGEFGRKNALFRVVREERK